MVVIRENVAFCLSEEYRYFMSGIVIARYRILHYQVGRVD
jgi:hypothetical protein